MPQADPQISLEDLDKAPSNLPVSTQPVPFNDVEKLRTKFDEVSTKNFELEEEVIRLRKSVATASILDSLIEPHARKAFWFMCIYCGAVGFILIASGFKAGSFQLDAGVLQVLAGSTAVTVIGLVGMVLTGIFVGARKH